MRSPLAAPHSQFSLPWRNFGCTPQLTSRSELLLSAPTPGPPATPLARSPGPRAPRLPAWPDRSRPALAPSRGYGRRCAVSSSCSSPPQSSSCRRREPRPAWKSRSDYRTHGTWVTMRLLLRRFVRALLDRRYIGEGENASAFHWLLAVPIAAAAGLRPPFSGCVSRLAFPAACTSCPGVGRSQKAVTPRVLIWGWALAMWCN